jgi:hypothetical protein
MFISAPDDAPLAFCEPLSPRRARKLHSLMPDWQDRDSQPHLIPRFRNFGRRRVPGVQRDERFRDSPLISFAFPDA